MNESANNQPDHILLNGEDLGWKKGFRWPKSISYEGVDYQDFGAIPGCDCFNLNEHIYRSEGVKRALIIDRFRDGRGRFQVDPGHVFTTRKRVIIHGSEGTISIDPQISRSQ